MKTIGLIGGTGWPSTVEYYRIINQEINKELGGDDAARLILYSVNYGDMRRFRQEGHPEKIFEMFLHAAEKLSAVGADCILLCANTTHQYAEEIQKRISTPLLHIADAAAKAITAAGMQTVGLMGTKMTMEMDFYKERLAEFGITAIVPELEERDYIQSIIDNELLKEVFKPETRQHLHAIMNQLHQSGAQGIILGCTEIPLIIKQEDTPVPLFDTLELHVKAAVDFALS
jgi:aspartate racemase